MKNFLFSLRTQILLNLLIIMIATVALLGTLMLKMSERDILEEKVKSGRAAVASLVNAIGQNPEQPGSLASIRPFIDGFSLEGVIVVGADGKLFYPEGVRDKGSTTMSPSIQKALSSGQTVVDIGGSLVISAPIVRGEATVGALSASFSLDEVRARIGRSQRLALIYLLLDSIALILMGSFLFSRAVTRPIDRLVEATEKISEGRFDYRVEVPGSSELGLLARSFNAMIGRIKEQLSQLTRAEKEVIRSEKLASLGRMASGIAHELGNPVSALTGYLDILSRGAHSNGKEKEIVQGASREVRRMDQIIRGLLDFARQREIKLEYVDVNQVIKDVLSILTPQKILAGIDVKMDLKEGLPPARADASLLGQVIINMILNSRDAMAEGRAGPPCREVLQGERAGEDESQGGSIERAERATAMPSQGTLTFATEAKDGSLRIVISDTGTGIRKDDIPRIFDPFFTTKDPGKGSGLGLSVCERIVDSFGGKILVESELRKGSTFTILLPERHEHGKEKDTHR